MTMSQSMKQCYDLLSQTGRAFVITINCLDEELRDAICVYYLVQRAVDTLEDDMAIANDVKVTMLTSIDKYLQDPTWRYTESSDEYAVVLENFPCITQAIRELPKKYRDIILKYGSQIGQRMTPFVGKDFASVEEVNEYCRKVTSHNSVGILDLFVAAGLEVEIQDKSLLEEGSIIVQKTNILRDFNKDWKSGRLYYPRNVWSKYVNNPGDFLKPENCDKGVECVNELVTDALQYTIPCLRFLQSLRSSGAIRFFGIHQILAIATIERCYNNPRVLTESVKLGRPETSEIISSTSSLGEIIDNVRLYTQKFYMEGKQQIKMSENMNQCYHLLHETGRAFATIIDFQNGELRDALCLFYLVLRAADAVEDDMTIPQNIKKTMLTSFDKYLVDVTWKYSQSNDEYAIVLERFPCITQALAELPRKYRSIILELGIEMGQKMATFVGKEFITMEDTNEYCRQLCGIFWIGFVHLFVASGLEREIQDVSLIEQSSLLIQKTNILRDFRKDWKSGRLYYPKDVWSKYVNSPGDFLKPENLDKGVECVNELVTDALQYTIPYVRFLHRLGSSGAIKFFGIHQVITVATLERCYNNPSVFTEAVKIGRDETSETFKSVSCFTDVMDKVRYYIDKV